MSLSNEDIKRIKDYARMVASWGGPYAFFPEEHLLKEASHVLHINLKNLTKKQQKELIKDISEIEANCRSSRREVPQIKWIKHS